MRPHCNNDDPDRSAPILAGPAHAAAAIRLSAPPAHGRAIVALLCDASHRLLLAVAVENAPASSVPQVVDLVLAVAASGGIRGLVVGIVQPRLGPLPVRQAEALRGLAAGCAGASVDLLDVLLVGPRGFRSVHYLADAPRGGEDGDQ
ncbi:MAG: hypothetical protein ACRD12_12270 [Acidimicrobiales bacterium]